MSPILLDRQTQLTPVRMEDAKELYALVDQNRAYLRQWMPWVDATSSVESTEFFLEDALRQERENDGLHFALRYQSKIVGIIGFHRLDTVHHQTSLGYWLGEKYQGKGLMTRSVQALVQFAFEQWLVHRIEIRCAIKNFKSAAIPKRLGFSREGTLRDSEFLYDHFVDLDVYSLLKPEWESSRRSSEQ